MDQLVKAFDPQLWFKPTLSGSCFRPVLLSLSLNRGHCVEDLKLLSVICMMIHIHGCKSFFMKYYCGVGGGGDTSLFHILRMVRLKLTYSTCGPFYFTTQLILRSRSVPCIRDHAFLLLLFLLFVVG